LRFEDLRPTPPEFQLAGDAERVAITCAAMGVDATDLELPVPLDRTAYRRALATLTDRGLIASGRLTEYGREVEALPVERAWGELLVRGGPELAPVLAVASNVDSLHRMTRDERDLRGGIVRGSDHLTAYNLYAEAVNQFGATGFVYGLPRHVFSDDLTDWADERGVLVKAIEDLAMGTAAVYRALELPLPRALPYASKDIRDRFVHLVAEVMPFDLVMDDHTADGQEARVGRSSFAGNWGAVAGSLRFFADRFGTPRASIEGTTIPYDLVRRYARSGAAAVRVSGPRKHQRLEIVRTREYFGFELESSTEPLKGTFPASVRDAAREALAEGLLSGGLAHPDQAAVRQAAQRLREWWRRSGGRLEVASEDALREVLLAQLAGVESWSAFQQTRVTLAADALVDPGTREALDRLPSTIRIFGDTTGVEYGVERGEAIIRIRLREGQARRLQPHDLPEFDRPVRFAVLRGEAPALEASTLDALRALLRSGSKARSARPKKGKGRRGPEGPRKPRRRR
jgi:hypothetical protein